MKAVVNKIFLRFYSSRKFSYATILVLNVLYSFQCFAQTDIPLGTWRMHLSYNTITDITFGNNQVFGAAQSGVLVLNREDNSLTTYNTLTGLSSTEISALSFDASRNQLLVAYADGNLDIVRDNAVTNFNRLKILNTITGSKIINHISIKNDFAYLAVDYAIVVFDLNKLEIKETWRDLGPSGESLKIFETLFLHDSIFAATEKGILAGKLSDNLLDFAKWKRFNTGEFANIVTSLALFNAKVYATVNGQGLYTFNGSAWNKIAFAGSNFASARASSKALLIVADNKVWRLDTSGQLVQLADDLIANPLIAIEDEQGIFWIGDSNNGMVSTLSGDFSAYIPNGPTFTKAFRLAYEEEKIYALPGGFSTVGLPSGNDNSLNYFESASWKTVNTTLPDLTDVEFQNGNKYIASFGGGLQAFDHNGNIIIFDETNSPLQNLDPSGKQIYISALENSDKGLWVINYGVVNPLLLLKSDNTWQSFPSAYNVLSYVTDVVEDGFGNLWMPVHSSKGGGLLTFDYNNNAFTFKNEVANNGALPDRNVNAVVTDLDNNVWVGTNSGAAYFYSLKQDAVKPIFENRFLLKDEKITSIAVDGGNRKWIGTQRGVWLFNASGEALIYNFTELNSPLLSNVITDISINQKSGEVFFATDKGIISFRSDATSSTAEFQSVKIFPNPVDANFSGTIGITGLSTNAYVKITDVSGKLVWETQASGGTATWNVRDFNGKRAATGIYLVFAASADGSENKVGKIAVVN